MKQINFLFLLLFNFQLGVSQMYVHNPERGFWTKKAAQIENVDFEIRPAGVFAEVAISFDLMPSDAWTDNSEGVQLEFTWDFNLDKKAVFNDSWLYIDNYISYGEIYEKGEGTGIYEGIVSRRSDPSILTKYSGKSYDLKVYPVFPESHRRVRLSYLVPFDFQDKSPSVDIDIASILDQSAVPPENITLSIYDDSNWFHQPLSEQELEPIVSSSSTKYKIEDIAQLRTIDISYSHDDPSAEAYFGLYEEDGEQYYQMVYFPEFESTREPTYNLIVLDFDEDYSNRGIEYYIAELESQLDQLEDTDFFNIIYSDFAVKLSYDTWTPATDLNISNAIQELFAENIDRSGRLSSLLPQALTFLEENNQDAIISQFTSDMTVDFDLRISNFATGWLPSDRINNVRYYGNTFLYESLVLDYGGIQYQAKNYDFHDAINEMFDSVQETFLGEFDFDIESEDGFAYSTYSSFDNETGLKLNRPIFSTGKFIGEFPIDIDLKLVENSEIGRHSLTLQESNLNLKGAATDVWHSQFILENEFDYELRPDVIRVSEEQRLLSFQTVFLCLENEPDPTGNEDPNNTATEDESESGVTISAYPNPFAEKLTIDIKNVEKVRRDQVRVDVIDMKGSLITSLTNKVRVTGDGFSILWDDLTDLESGMYTIRITLADEVITKRVIHVE